MFFIIGLKEGIVYVFFISVDLKCDWFIEVIVLEYWCSGDEVFGFVKCVILCLCLYKGDI